MMTTDSSSATKIEDLPEWFNAATDLLDPNLAAGRSAKAAFIDHRRSITYGQLAERVERMAGAFWSMGIRREERVLLCLLDTIDFPTVFLGALQAGVIPVPLSTLQVEEDYRWILENSGARAVFVSDTLGPVWQPIARDNPHVLFISSGEGGWVDLETMLSTASPSAGAPTHRDDLAFILYTSGSTGRPKGVMHSHGSLRLTSNLFGRNIIGYRETDRVLSVAKLFFAYGLGNALTFPLAAGATAVLNKDRPTPQSITELMVRYDVSVLNGVPTFFASWFANDLGPLAKDVASLRIATSAGERLPSELCRAFQERYGADLIDGLGSTEMLHVYLSQRPGDVRYGCTGRTVPGYELRIVDEAGEPARPGEFGELHVKGPTSAMGYWRNRDQSKATFGGQWIRTGDRFRCSADGWFTYGGRSDEMLKVGGIYVSPSEIEEVLAAHECVVEAAVVGVADPSDLIKPCAHVVLQAAHAPSAELEAMLKAYVKSRLAPYKTPRWIVFTNALPKTATGKIQRFLLSKRS